MIQLHIIAVSELEVCLCRPMVRARFYQMKCVKINVSGALTRCFGTSTTRRYITTAGILVINLYYFLCIDMVCSPQTELKIPKQLNNAGEG